MKIFFLTLLMLGVTVAAIAQQKQKDTAKPKFTPPTIVKDEATTNHTSGKVKRFTPPTIVKDDAVYPKKAKQSTKAKFRPPVIVKDSARL